MTTEEVDPTAVIRTKAGTAAELVPQHQVFISHAHADAELAACVRLLIKDAFSGVVGAFFSADPSPAGGISPGDEWFRRIHSELARSEAVWVLATPSSISHPWLYWEAGIGRALCSTGIVPLRVQLPAEGLLSPLNAYQSYDGLQLEGELGIVALLGKVSKQTGMDVHADWLETCAKQFVSGASAYKPAPPSHGVAPKVSAEQVSRFEALLTRLEATTSGAASSATPIRATRRPARPNDISNPTTVVHVSPAELIKVVEENRGQVRASSIDGDGDVWFSVPTSVFKSGLCYLGPPALEEVLALGTKSPAIEELKTLVASARSLLVSAAREALKPTSAS